MAQDEPAPPDAPSGGETTRARYQTVGLIVGPVAAAILFALPTPAGLSPAGWRLAAVAVLMAVWWATEALPIPVTAFIPIIAFPVLGITSIDDAAAPYMDPVILLLLGGFIIARSLEHWNLHRRIALNILARVGSSPGRIIFGFMLATAVISMWVSNTATTAMMLPIGLSVIAVIGVDSKVQHNFAIALLLAIAYSASIGGLATLVGTPTNALLAGFMRETYDIEIAFNRWMLIGLPVVAVMLPTAWAVLTKLAFRLPTRSFEGAEAAIGEHLAALGPITRPEKRTAILFAVVAVTWCLRPQIAAWTGIKGLSDSGIAIAAAFALFLIPSGDTTGRGRCLLDWPSAAKLNWGVILLFGGGLSLANAVKVAGLATWVGQGLAVLTTWPPILLAARNLHADHLPDRAHQQRRHHRRDPAGDRRDRHPGPSRSPGDRGAGGAGGDLRLHAARGHAAQRHGVRRGLHPCARYGEGRIPAEHRRNLRDHAAQLHFGAADLRPPLSPRVPVDFAKPPPI